MLIWGMFSTFLGFLIVFIAFLGGSSEIDMTVIFMFELIVHGELHIVGFLLGQTASVLTA